MSKDDIFTIPDNRLEAQHKRLLRRLRHDYEQVVVALQQECVRFPNSAMAWPIILKRKGEALEVQIKVVNVLSRPDGAKFQQSMQYYGRPPAYVAHKRVIDGNYHELAEQALAVIRATKTIAEVLTVLEQTKCSEEDTSS